MAGGHGGPRTPAKPAVVSGPGALSRRTDGNFQTASTMPDLPYGEKKQEMASQAIAPMAGQQPMAKPADVVNAQQPDPRQPYQGGDFGAPTDRPNEPVTSGVPIGDGPGPEALTYQPQQPGQGTGSMTSLLQRLSPMDTTGILGQLMQAAAARNA